MADEALSCFTSLLENVSGWVADLENILEGGKERQQAIISENKPITTTAKAFCDASKSSSLKSGRFIDGAEPSTGLRPALKYLSNSDALGLSQRKRKTASVASGGQAGPCKFRNKATAVVYYDGETQKGFEQLVRAVGTSRNSVRKGKMSAKVDALSRSGSSSSASTCRSESGDEDGDYSKITSGLKYQSSRSRSAFGRNDGLEFFDRVDGRLEKAQSLCERAAHQVLRDGDCTLEVTNAKEHFSEALKMVTAELPAMRKKAEKSAERRRRSAEQHRLEEEAEAALRALKPEHHLDDEVPNVVTNVDIPSDGDLEVDILEVDDCDSNSDSEEFNITSFSFTKAGARIAPQLRTSPRLAVH